MAEQNQRVTFNNQSVQPRPPTGITCVWTTYNNTLKLGHMVCSALMYLQQNP